MPQYRYAVNWKFEFMPNVYAKIEYRHDRDYKTTAGGSGKNDNVGMIELGMAF